MANEQVEISALTVNNTIVSLVSLYSSLLSATQQATEEKEQILGKRLLLAESAGKWLLSLDKETLREVQASLKSPNQLTAFNALCNLAKELAKGEL